MNYKAKGSRNERRSRDLFKAQGYEVMKAGASLGVFDLIAVGPSDIILAQVKTNSWPSKQEMTRIEELPCPPNCKKIVHRWRDRVGVPDVREVQGVES